MLEAIQVFQSYHCGYFNVCIYQPSLSKYLPLIINISYVPLSVSRAWVEIGIYWQLKLLCCQIGFVDARETSTRFLSSFSDWLVILLMSLLSPANTAFSFNCRVYEWTWLKTNIFISRRMEMKGHFSTFLHEKIPYNSTRTVYWCFVDSSCGPKSDKTNLAPDLHQLKLSQ